MKNTKLGDQEETIAEMLEPEAELDRQLVSPAKETRNQAIRYILWGLISVAVNLIVYYITYNVLGIEYQIANGITWVLAVQVAFWVDRVKVFEHHSHYVYREMGKFYATRIVTYFIESLILWLLVSVIGSPVLLAKVFGQVGAIVGNFFFSKWFVFRSK